MRGKNRLSDPRTKGKARCGSKDGMVGMVGVVVRFLVLVIVLGLGGVLVACAPDDAVPDGLPHGGELRWSIVGVQDIASLDPAHAGEQQSIMVMNLVFGGLVRLDEDLIVQPDGAESWQVSEDGRTYTFSIRRNLTFGDEAGTPVTAHDFLYSINRALSPETGAYSAPAHLKHIVGAADVIEGRAETISGVRAVDAYTLEIELDAPLAYFLSWLTSPNTFVVPQHLIEREGDAWTRHAFGTGPFRVREWRPDEAMILEMNPHYWRGRPGIDTVSMPFYQDSELAYQRYWQGTLDIVGNPQASIPAAYVSEVEDLPDFRSAPALAVRYVGFNNHLHPFDNTFVRKAFALGVDRHELTQRVLSGTAEPTARILPQGLAGSKFPVSTLTFDPDAARAALRLAGYLSGQELPPITLTYGEEGDNALVAQTLQRFWRDTLGITVQLEGLDLATFSQRLDETFHDPENGLQMYLSIWGADYPDPQNFLSQQLRTGSPNNNGHWSNPRFDELVDQADRMGALEQRQQRLELYNQAEQIAITEVGWLPLYNPRMNILMRPEVYGLVFTPKDILAPNWTTVRVARPEQQREAGSNP
jgi:peptide/nickel transport system substrate-binding protein/oligopeptide transport system substrate-binding protein